MKQRELLQNLWQECKKICECECECECICVCVCVGKGFLFSYSTTQASDNIWNTLTSFSYWRLS